MNLAFRSARRDDLKQCVQFMRDGFAYTETERSELLALWQTLLVQDAATAEVIADQAAPPLESVVYFGFAVFLTDEFCLAAKTVLPPFIAKQALGWHRSGRLPFLSARQIREANSPRGAGLTMLIMNSGGPDWVFNTERGMGIVHKQPEWILSSCRGYRMNEFLIESYGNLQCRWSLSAGFHLRTEYAGHPQPFAQDKQAYLHGVCKAEVEQALGSVVAPLFTYTPPRLLFRPAEQVLLRRALLGENDAAIADTLAIAFATVHKRWRTIFERVALADPDLLPLDAAVGRGAEKRTRLLRYLQHHPEELRPCLPPQRERRAV